MLHFCPNKKQLSNLCSNVEFKGTHIHNMYINKGTIITTISIENRENGWKTSYKSHNGIEI